MELLYYVLLNHLLDNQILYVEYIAHIQGPRIFLVTFRPGNKEE